MAAPISLRQRPGEPQLMVRLSGVFLIATAAIAAIAVSLPSQQLGSNVGLALIAAVSMMLGVGILRSADRVHPPSLHLLTALATGLITAALMLSLQVGNGPSLNIEMLYLCPALVGGYFLSPRGAAIQLGLITVGYGLVVLGADEQSSYGPGRWLVTTGTLTVTTLVVSRLRERSLHDLIRRGQTASLLEATLDATADGIAVISSGRLIQANAKLLELFHLPKDALIAGQADAALRLAVAQIRDSRTHDERLMRMTGLDGGPEVEQIQLVDGRILERHSQPQISHGEVVGSVVSFRDVTERNEAEHRLREIADYDSLTGLYSRHRFEAEVERETRFAQEHREGGALLLMNLDNFKYVNDTLGHRAGDEVILSIARVVAAGARSSDALARLSGDEFAILLPRTTHTDAREWADRLVQSVRDHAIVVDSQRVRMTASVGLVTFLGAERASSDLLVAADRAMYKAKFEGRNRVAVHSEDLVSTQEGAAHLTWNHQIREAIEQDRLVAHAQPILDLAQGQVTRYELLVRLRTPEGEILPPGAFLAHAERYGMVQEIDAWIRRKAIALIAQEASAGRRLELEVNVSAHSIADENLADEIRGDLETSGIDPSCLTFEMTETAAIGSMDTAREFARRVSQMGCQFALDDFGSGFASFYYLKHFPVDIIKIDGDFVRDIEQNLVDRLVVDAIVQIARRLRMHTIAEFAENESTLRLLRSRGVDFAQGYGVGRPEPAENLVLGGNRGAFRLGNDAPMAAPPLEEPVQQQPAEPQPEISAPQSTLESPSAEPTVHVPSPDDPSWIESIDDPDEGRVGTRSAVETGSWLSRRRPMRGRSQAPVDPIASRAPSLFGSDSSERAR